MQRVRLFNQGRVHRTALMTQACLFPARKSQKVSKTCPNFTEFYVHVAQCRPRLDLSLSDVSAIFISGSVDDVMFSYTAATARHTDGANAAK